MSSALIGSASDSPQPPRRMVVLPAPPAPRVITRRFVKITWEEDAVLVRLFPVGDWEAVEWLFGAEAWSLEFLNWLVWDEHGLRRLR